jgi:NAD(P)-dependent dehydrogenase (short-subunit alcohol dehydrogenase family)
MRLKGKIAIVTGGAHGMGAVEAKLFAEQGAVVVVADVLEREGEQVAAAIRQAGGTAAFAKLDVTDDADWQRVIDATVAAHGRLDILVNNAGISGSVVPDHDDVAGWQRIITVNATSMFLGTRRAAKAMAKAGGGSIVNISSIMGVVGSADGHPAYHASKGAIRTYTKAAAVRYGPQGVRVNSVHPGYLPAMLHGTNANTRAQKIPMIPLRRIGEPIEVAQAVLFLASDEASYVSGAELAVDGGFLAH